MARNQRFESMLYSTGPISTTGYQRISEIRRFPGASTYRHYWDLREIETGRIVECLVSYDRGYDDDSFQWRYKDENTPTLWKAYFAYPQMIREDSSRLPLVDPNEPIPTEATQPKPDTLSSQRLQDHLDLHRLSQQMMASSVLALMLNRTGPSQPLPTPPPKQELAPHVKAMKKEYKATLSQYRNLNNRGYPIIWKAIVREHNNDEQLVEAKIQALQALMDSLESKLYAEGVRSIDITTFKPPAKAPVVQSLD